MSTTTNAINSINSAVAELVSQGWNVEVKLGFSSASAPALAIAGEPSSAPQTASFSAAGATTVAAPVEAAPAPVFPVEARLAQVVGTTLYLADSDRTSSGYAIVKDGRNTDTVATVCALDRKNEADGFINVYPNSIGTDVHATEAKARRYASANLVEVLPVFID